MPVETQIQHRQDTAANWTATNPTLAAGELGWESDTNQAKMGDGVTAWNSLVYFVSVPDFSATPQTLAGNVDDYTLPDDSGILIVDNTSNVQLRGIVAKTDGYTLSILNVGTNRVRVRAENANSVAANRFGGVGNKDIENGELMTVIYNSTISRWITPWS